MHARAAEYQEKWRQEMATLNNPTLKAAAQTRATKVQSRYDTISEKAQAARTAYEPFIRDLKEVQTYLSNDLTAPAVTAAKPVFEKAQTTGAELKVKLDDLAAEMGHVAAEMSPGGTPSTNN